MNTQSTRERNYKMIILNKQKFTKAHPNFFWAISNPTMSPPTAKLFHD